MKLRYSSQKYFYMASFFLIAMAGIITLLGHSNHTYAEEEADAGIVSNMHYVTIYDQGQKLTVKTDARTVEEVLKRAKISLDSADKTDPELTAEINTDNYNINIYRAKPVIITDGITKKYLMSASSDGSSIAAEADFTIYDGDRIEIKENSTDFLETGMATTYTVIRAGGATITEEEDIPFSEQTESDSNLPVGQTRLVQVGEIGRKTKHYRVKFVNGKESSRELISEEVTKEPVARITAVGMKSNVPAEWGTCANWAREAGVSEDDLYVALTIIYKESGCRTNAENSSTHAYGIPQALPGGKMASAGSDWETNPVTQIRWMISYVTGRYGGWQQAWDFWQTHHWY